MDPGRDLVEGQPLDHEVVAVGIGAHDVEGLARAVNDLVGQPSVLDLGRDIGKPQRRVGRVHLQTREGLDTRRINQGDHGRVSTVARIGPTPGPRQGGILARNHEVLSGKTPAVIRASLIGPRESGEADVVTCPDY